MDSLKLNSIPQDVFATVNSQNTSKGNINRNDLIVTGRLVCAEYNGRKKNQMLGKRNLSKEYTPRMNDAEYSQLSQGHKDKLFMYCAACQYEVQGRTPPENAKQVYNDLSLLNRGSIFLTTLAGITQEVLTPMLPYVISDVAGELMNWGTVPLGQTREITVHSNDVFMFQDGSWGSTRSKPVNRLYDNTFTLNPTPKDAHAEIKWFQMVANDTDIGWYYNAIMSGMYSKIMAIFTNALTTAATSSTYVPSYLQYASYNSANWANATVRVAEANHLRRNQIMAFGDYRALQVVLPSGTPSDAALTYGLGEAWSRNGFLSVVGGVPLYEVENVQVPGTVNTTGIEVFPTNQIFLAGRAGDSYAPIYGAFAEGSPITIQMDPSMTGNYAIDISVTAIFDVVAVFASKLAVISNVAFA